MGFLSEELHWAFVDRESGARLRVQTYENYR